MKCLVIGASGFIGSHLVDKLVEAGHHVRCFDRVIAGPITEVRSAAGREMIEGDISVVADITRAMEGCDVCFHLASTTLPKSSNDDPVFDVETNVLATLRMLGVMVRTGVKKVIYSSSGGTVYGIPSQIPITETHPTDPTCSYGIAKLTIEKYLALFYQLHGLDYAVLRLANPYGERQRVSGSQGAVAVFLGRALKKQPVDVWGDGTVVRDYIHIDDVVGAMLKSIESHSTQRIFNIGSGKGTKLLELLNVIDSVLGYRTERIFRPSRSFDVPKNVLSIERAHREWGWCPEIDLYHGIRRFADWIQAQPTQG